MKRFVKRVAVRIAAFFSTRQWAWTLAGILIGCGLVNLLAQQWNNALCCGCWALGALLEVNGKTLVVHLPPDTKT